MPRTHTHTRLTPPPPPPAPPSPPCVYSSFHPAGGWHPAASTQLPARTALSLLSPRCHRPGEPGEPGAPRARDPPTPPPRLGSVLGRCSPRRRLGLFRLTTTDALYLPFWIGLRRPSSACCCPARFAVVTTAEGGCGWLRPVGRRHGRRGGRSGGRNCGGGAAAAGELRAKGGLCTVGVVRSRAFWATSSCSLA